MINFPSNPSLNQFYSAGGKTWKWVGNRWIIANANTTIDFGLTTANVPESGNLYFTNTRARAAFTSGNNITIAANGLITANSGSGSFIGSTTDVPEGANLYFTNTRVISALIAGQNITIESNGRISSSGGSFIGSTDDVPEGANLYYSNARVYANVIPLLNVKANITDLTSANVTELTNLYFTNARVYANVIGLVNNKANITDLTTSNVTEGNNLYFTNTRAIQAFTSGSGITVAANGLLTANPVIEANAGVVIAYTQTLVSTNSNVYTLNTSVSDPKDLFVSVNGLIQIPTTDYLVSGNLITFTATELPQNSYIEIRFFGTSGVIKNSNVITDSFTEGNINLFFTNTRARSAFISGENITIASNGMITAAGGVSGNTNSLSEGSLNLYYSNDRVYANVIGLINNKANVTDLTTTNVIEGNNLYFTNARVVSSLIAGTGIVIEANGRINSVTSITISNTSPTSNIQGTFWLHDEYGDLYIYYSNSWILIGGGGGSGSTITSTTDLSEGSNLYYTNARVYSNVISLINLKANTADLSTSNIIEGSNLYFTNARVYANVIDIINTKANIGDLTTSNVSEGNNLYFTNARVYSNIVQLNYATIGYVNNSIANIVDSAPAVLDTLKELANALGNDASFSTTVTNQLSLKANSSDLTTANTIELTNLYFTNARVYANVIGLLNNKANVNDLTTSNISEGNNLYFTNARVYANVIGFAAIVSNVSNAAVITVNTTTPTSICSISLTTSGKRVLLIATGDMNPNQASVWHRLQIYRDSNPVGKRIICESINNSQNNPWALVHIDTPSAGTYVYSVRAWQGNGSATYGEEGEVQAPTIAAMELLNAT